MLLLLLLLGSLSNSYATSTPEPDYSKEDIEKFKKAYATAKVFDERTATPFHTDDEAAQAYAYYCPNGYCDNVRGKRIGTSIGAPTRHWCTLFSGKYLAEMPSPLVHEFLPEIGKCYLKGRSAISAERVKFPEHLTHCTVDYALGYASAGGHWKKFRYSFSCVAALNLMRKLSEWNVNASEIADMRICKSRPYLPAFATQQCHSFPELSLESAIGLLERCTKGKE